VTDCEHSTAQTPSILNGHSQPLTGMFAARLLPSPWVRQPSTAIRPRLARYVTSNGRSTRLRACEPGNTTIRPQPADCCPLDRCAELLGTDLATIRKAAANVEAYIRADAGQGMESRAA
jgi:hypothetical protein